MSINRSIIHGKLAGCIDLESLGLGNRLLRTLRHNGISSLEDLLRSTPDELYQLPGIGRGSAAILQTSILSLKESFTYDSHRKSLEVARRIANYRAAITKMETRIADLETKIEVK